jgi:hypothetical protein
VSLVDDTLEVTANVTGEEELPNEVQVQVALPLVLEQEGMHAIQIQLGGARARYRFMVVPEAE